MNVLFSCLWLAVIEMLLTRCEWFSHSDRHRDPKSHLVFVRTMLFTAFAKNGMWRTFVLHHSDGVTVRLTDVPSGSDVRENTHIVDFCSFFTQYSFSRGVCCSWCMWGLMCVCFSHHVQQWEPELLWKALICWSNQFICPTFFQLHFNVGSLSAAYLPVTQIKEIQIWERYENNLAVVCVRGK